MRRLLLVLSVSYLLLLGATTTAAVLGLRADRPPSAAYSAVWRLDMSDGSQGSAFAVEQRGDRLWLATARHVLRGATPLRLVRDGEDLYEVRVEWESGDLALVSAACPDAHPVLGLSTSDPATGDPVWAVGYPMGGQLRVSQGCWCGFPGFTADIMFGSSGGPVLDSEGRVVGVATRVMSAYTAAGDRFAVSFLGGMEPVGPIAAALDVTR
jgi:S1-C subfamily serine protease